MILKHDDYCIEIIKKKTPNPSSERIQILDSFCQKIAPIRRLCVYIYVCVQETLVYTFKDNGILSFFSTPPVCFSPTYRHHTAQSRKSRIYFARARHIYQLDFSRRIRATKDDLSQLTPGLIGFSRYRTKKKWKKGEIIFRFFIATLSFHSLLFLHHSCTAYFRIYINN